MLDALPPPPPPNRQDAFGDGDDFPLIMMGLDNGPLARLTAVLAADWRSRSADEDNVVKVLLLGKVVVLEATDAAAEEIGEDGR